MKSESINEWWKQGTTIRSFHLLLLVLSIPIVPNSDSCLPPVYWNPLEPIPPFSIHWSTWEFIFHRTNGRIEVSPWRVIVWWNDSCKQRVEERILSDLLRRPISIIVSLSKTQLFSIHPFKCQLIQWFTLSLLVESLRMELEWFIGILSLFDDHLKWVVFDHLGSFSISIIALLIPLIPCWFHFYGPNEVWNGCVRCFDIVEVKDIVCCWMNATPWKQNGISLHSVCCLLDCDLLWCWINRWIRLWKEMIGWFCRLFLLSSDNLSVGEESCESAIPWFLDLISFGLTPVSLASFRVRVSQLQSSPLLSILIKL